MLSKAVVLAGGRATRLRPLSTTINKHMLPVYDRPMIQRVIEQIVRWGIEEVLILISNNFALPVFQLLEDGEKFGCDISYSYQWESVEPGKRLAKARRFAGDDPFLFICGDSFYLTDLHLEGLRFPHLWAMPLDPAFDDFTKYAEVEVDRRGRVLSLVENPTEQRTKVVQTGAWAFEPDVFDRAARLGDDARVRTLIHGYVGEGKMWATKLPPRSFLDLGTPDALHRAGIMARDEACAVQDAAE